MSRERFFHAEQEREIYVELPEDIARENPGKCGKLLKSMYGTRDAAKNWEKCYADFMTSIGFQRGLASSCAFLSPSDELENSGAWR